MGGPTDFLLTYIFWEVSRQTVSTREKSTQIPTSNIHPSLSPWLVGAFHFERTWEVVKWGRCGRREALWRHLSPHHSSSEAALWGQWAQQREDFRTSLSPIWTLFIALRKALCALSLEQQSKPGHVLPLLDFTAKHTHRLHLHKPHYSHLLAKTCSLRCSEDRSALEWGGWLTRCNTDQGGENEAGFEMQIHSLCAGWEQNIQQCFMQNTRSHFTKTIQICQNVFFYYWNEKWLFVHFKRPGLSHGEMLENYISTVIMLQGWLRRGVSATDIQFKL